MFDYTSYVNTNVDDNVRVVTNDITLNRDVDDIFDIHNIDG